MCIRDRIGVVPVVLQCCQSFLDRPGIEGCQPDALNRAGVAEVFEDFIHEELAFPVRVARVDDRSGLTEQIADHLKLSAGAFLGLEPPLTGNHG